jgi:CheY-like chemotaxis protein
VRQLLIFGRGIEGARGPVHLPDLIDELVKISRETFPKNIVISSTIARGLWPVRGDATQLHQVLLNLCVNARDAMHEGGSLSLSAANVELDASYAAMNPDAKPGPHVVVRVADTGLGIPPDIAAKIFDPFFTTKTVGKGTGLGLSTVLGIVKSHGGFVTLQSEPGMGTTFEVYLPALPGEKAVTETAQEDGPPKGDTELILVVDDEESIRCVLSETLQRHNYRVLTARDGAEASAVFARNMTEVKLVVTDLDMPFLDGVNLIRAIRRIQPDIKVIVSSGLGENRAGDTRLAELKALGVKTILEKPYTADRVLTAVHRALSAPVIAAPARVAGK